jgi:hypothetical protein
MSEYVFDSYNWHDWGQEEVVNIGKPRDSAKHYCSAQDRITWPKISVVPTVENPRSVCIVFPTRF